jgi:hypothetical protein
VDTGKGKLQGCGVLTFSPPVRLVAENSPRTHPSCHYLEWMPSSLNGFASRTRTGKALKTGRSAASESYGSITVRSDGAECGKRTAHSMSSLRSRHGRKRLSHRWKRMTRIAIGYIKTLVSCHSSLIPNLLSPAALWNGTTARCKLRNQNVTDFKGSTS